MHRLQTDPWKRKKTYLHFQGADKHFFSPFSYPLGKKVPFGDKVLKGSLCAERQPLPFSMSASKLGWWFQRAAVGKCLKMFKFSNTKPCQNMFSRLAGVWWKIHQGKRMGKKSVALCRCAIPWKLTWRLLKYFVTSQKFTNQAGYHVVVVGTLLRMC